MSSSDTDTIIITCQRVLDRAARLRLSEGGKRGNALRFERQADPDGSMPADERSKRAAELRREACREMGQRSAAARRARKQSQAVAA